MYVVLRFLKDGGSRLSLGLLLAMLLFFSSVGTLFAGTTGTISGTVTDSKTGAPIVGVTVGASAPTGHFTTKTDAKGFYAINGVSPDTYTISFEFEGYQAASVAGISVFQDNVARVDEALNKALRTIGRTTARGTSGAYQPTQTQDTYTVNSAQIETVNGRSFNTSESNLLTSLPGASLDSSGYPVLRGGRENESGYSFEGIPIADSYSNQFQNSLSVVGIGSFQVVPGAGNATIGNAGTGSINYTAKRGTYPAFGSIEAEVQNTPFTHQFTFEYGFATPSGNLSNYVSFIGQRNGFQYGPRGLRSVDNGTFSTGTNDTTENNFVDNFVYKFGKDKSYELQGLYQNQVDRFGSNYGGGIGTLHDPLSDPYLLSGITLSSIPAFLGFTQAEFNNTYASLPGHPNGALLPQSATFQPNEVYKVQLSHNFDPSTFLRLAYYGVNAITTFDLPDYNNFGGYELQGSDRTGVSADFTKQLNSRNLLQIGGKFEYQKPTFAIESYDDAAEATGGLGPFFGIGTAKGFEFPDFLSPTDANCATTLANLGLTAKCGYLSRFFGANVPKIPLYDRTSQVDRGDFALYINDQLTASDRLRFELGVRADGNTTKFPSTYDGVISNIPYDESHPLIVQPRAAVNFQLSKNDSVRASFARSTQFPPLGVVARTIDRADFNIFNDVPSYDNLLGPYNPANSAATQARFCGATRNLPCANYGEQLFSEYQYGVAATQPLQPVEPETFTSYDFSYSHQFPSNIALRVTPFYTRGYDIVDRVSNVIAVNPTSNKPIFGPALSTNLGSERTTGVEFQLTKESTYGLSGELSATYLNKFSNVPPLSSSEDFFPTIPTASLQLGNQYRVGYLSPFQATAAFQYRTRFGLRINPQITYNRGYPLNPGLTTATFINGKAVNLPLTDVTGPSVGSTPSQYVDPANPGSVFKPNVAAALGTPESGIAGGVLSNARFSTNLTIELSPPGTRSTFGVQIFNLFNQLYATPSLNLSAQPIASGVLGPQTGQLYSYQTAFAATTPYLGATPASQYGQSPYEILQTNQPTAFLFYYQLKI